MNIKKIFSIPTDDAGCDAIRIAATPVVLVTDVLRYKGRQERPFVRITFNNVIAFRFSDEMRTLSPIEGSFDTIVEIIDSNWLDELRLQEPADLALSAHNCHHFACFFTNNGYLEVISEDIDAALL